VINGHKPQQRLCIITASIAVFPRDAIELDGQISLSNRRPDVDDDAGGWFCLRAFEAEATDENFKPSRVSVPRRSARPRTPARIPEHLTKGVFDYRIQIRIDNEFESKVNPTHIEYA